MNDYTKYKKVLETEFENLEKELSKLGVQNIDDPSSWDVKNPEMDIMGADENEVADRSEEIQIDSIILNELTIRYNNVVRALRKIEDGTYGMCEIDNKPIEEDRLLANPAARTCMEHVEQEQV